MKAQERREDRSAYAVLSGTVVEFSSRAITVRREVPGQDAQNRKFSITEDSKVEGTLAVGVKVTVAYVEGDDVARRILVQEKPPGVTRAQGLDLRRLGHPSFVTCRDLPRARVSSGTVSVMTEPAAI